MYVVKEAVFVYSLAVSFSVLLMESIVSERTPALGTEEMFGMPGRAQGSHAFL